MRRAQEAVQVPLSFRRVVCRVSVVWWMRVGSVAVIWRMEDEKCESEVVLVAFFKVTASREGKREL